MLTAVAHVGTDRPGRYLVQLCRHFSQKGRHLIDGWRAHLTGGTRARPGLRARLEMIRDSQIDVEWSETHGIIQLGWGQCTMQASPGTLTLRVEAADAENLQRVQEVVGEHLVRFGRRDRLAVNWQQPQAPSSQPGGAGQMANPDLE